MTNVVSLANQFAEDHRSGRVLVLPTVWDTWSATVAAEVGFPGLTVGGHPVANSLGEEDGEHMDFADYLAIVKRIVDAVDVPVSTDVDSGYGLEPAELIDRILAVGAVGANIEDVVHSEAKRVRSVEEQAAYIAGARAAADAAGVDFVINGRTDAVKLGTEVFEDPLAEAVIRIQAMVDAGAQSVYPVGLSNAQQVETLVQAVPVPVNVTAHPKDSHGAGDLAALSDLGVRRITFGPMWQNWLADTSKERLAAWKI